MYAGRLSICPMFLTGKHGANGTGPPFRCPSLLTGNHGTDLSYGRIRDGIVFVPFSDGKKRDKRDGTVLCPVPLSRVFQRENGTDLSNGIIWDVIVFVF